MTDDILERAERLLRSRTSEDSRSAPNDDGSSRSEFAQRRYTGHIQRLRTHLGDLQDFASRYSDTKHGQKMSKIVGQLQHSLKYADDED